MFSDPSNWFVFTTNNSDISDNYILSITFDNSGYTWIGTKYGGLVRYDGTRWDSFIPDSMSCLPQSLSVQRNNYLAGPQVNALYDIAIDEFDIKWIGTKIGGFYQFDDNQWTLFNTKNSSLPDDHVWTIVIDENNTKWLGTIGGGVAAYNQTGWTIYSAENSQLLDNEIWTIAIDKYGNKWFGTSLGLIKFTGTNWKIFNTENSPLPVNTIWSIVIDKNDIKWIGTKGGGLIKFDDHNWSVFDRTNSDLPENNIWTIALDSTDNIWLGTLSSGIVKFNGKNWKSFNTETSPLPNNTIWDIEIDRYNNIWIGTNYGLAIYRQDTVFTRISEGNEYNKTTDFFLRQNFPNPFNSITRIEYFIFPSSNLKIEIYDVSGKLVRILRNGRCAAGWHEIMWDGTDSHQNKISSGIYICRLIMENKTAVRKFLFLK